MGLFALLFFGSIGLGALLVESSDGEDDPASEVDETDPLPEEESVINGTEGYDNLNGSIADDTMNGLGGGTF